MMVGRLETLPGVVHSEFQTEKMKDYYLVASMDSRMVLLMVSTTVNEMELLKGGAGVAGMVLLMVRRLAHELALKMVAD